MAFHPEKPTMSDVNSNRLLSPAKVGDRLWARDRLGYWYEARVVQVRGEQNQDVKVHFMGWCASHDEWVMHAQVDTRLREHEPDYDDESDGDYYEGEYEVESLLKKRKRGDMDYYFVRWKGFSNDYDTWEPEVNLDPTLVQEFCARNIGTGGRGRKSVGPYVLTVQDPVADDVADSLASEWHDAIGRSAVALLKRQQLEWAGKRILHWTPCPPWLFKALHRRFCNGVLENNPGACARPPYFSLQHAVAEVYNASMHIV